MSVFEVPRMITILAMAKQAYLLARREYDNHRLHETEFRGATPKRRRKRSLYLERIRKEAREFERIRYFSEPERRLLIAAWDQGLLDEGLERDLASADQETGLEEASA
jgi:hypothetical protein